MSVDKDCSTKRRVGRPRKTISCEDGNDKLNVDGRYTNINLDYPICQYTLDGEFVRKYDSIRDAAYYTGFNYPNIWACVIGRTKKSHGYLWRKEGDEMDVKTKVEEKVGKIDEKETSMHNT